MVYLLFRTWRLNERHYGMLKQYSTLWTVNDVPGRYPEGLCRHFTWKYPLPSEAVKIPRGLSKGSFTLISLTVHECDFTISY
jgi:hypothetical protein